MARFDLEKLTTQLPVLNTARFQALQQRIQARQLIVKEGRRPHLGISTLVGKPWKPITFEERFKELQLLIQDYRQVVETLQRHRSAYHQFFFKLKIAVKEAVSEKCERIQLAEQKRLAQQQRSLQRKRPAFLDIIKRQEKQLSRSVRLLGQATFLLLRKVDLFAISLDKLADDQHLQESVLGELLEDLNDYHQIYELQAEIDQIERDIAEMADVALNFEDLMRDYLGPFQVLLEQVVSVDQDLLKAAEEIKNATANLLNDNFNTIAAFRLDQADSALLEFLIRSQLSRDWLLHALSRVQSSSLSQTLDLEQLLKAPSPATVQPQTSATPDPQLQDGPESQDVESASDPEQPIAASTETPDTAAQSQPEDAKATPADLSIHSAIENIQTFVSARLGFEASDDPSTPLTITVDPMEVPPQYSYLQTCLANQQWLEADQETRRLLLDLAGQPKQNFLLENQVTALAVADLGLLDQLWVIYSQGKFGLSVQKAIWESQRVGGQAGSFTLEMATEFGTQVQWREQSQWLTYDQLIFSIEAPMGHLPCLWYDATIQRGSFRRIFGLLSALFLRFQEGESHLNEDPN